MAVPSSGELSLRKIGAEKRFDQYGELQDGFFVGTMGQISLADVSTSGNSNGSTVDYEATNLKNPHVNRPDGIAGHSMQEFYAYDHDLNSTLKPLNTSTTSSNSAYAACQKSVGTNNAYTDTIGVESPTHLTSVHSQAPSSVYTSSSPTVLNRKGSGWWKHVNSWGYGYWFKLDSVGKCIDSGVCSLTSFTASSNSNFFGVCSAFPNQTYYHNGSGTFPAVGDIVYDNSTPSQNDRLSAGYYRFDATGTDRYFYIGSNDGEVDSIDTCDGFGGDP